MMSTPPLLQLVDARGRVRDRAEDHLFHRRLAAPVRAGRLDDELSLGVHETNLYGPVPIGVLATAAGSAAALGGSIST